MRSVTEIATTGSKTISFTASVHYCTGCLNTRFYAGAGIHDVAAYSLRSGGNNSSGFGVWDREECSRNHGISIRLGGIRLVGSHSNLFTHIGLEYKDLGSAAG